MMLCVSLLLVAILSLVLYKIRKAHVAKNRRRQLRVRDALTPEEQEARFDKMRRKLSQERKALPRDEEDDSEDQ